MKWGSCNEISKLSRKNQQTQHMYAGTYKLALKLIAAQVENGQIDKVAELLGQLACKTSENVSEHTTHVFWDIQSYL